MKKTIENLVRALISENLVKSNYASYAATAKKEGYTDVADIFSSIANNATKNTKRLSLLIESKEMESGVLDKVKFKFPSMISGERSGKMQINIERGFVKVSQFEKVDNDKNSKSFDKTTQKTYWLCKKCAYIHESEEIPESCSLCSSDADNWFLKEEHFC